MNKKPIIIGISGATASGKSLLARTIVEELDSRNVAVIGEDCYYKDRSHLTMEERAKINFDHPDAFEHDLLIQHLKQLQAHQAIQVPIYDHAQHVRTRQTRLIDDHLIIVLEGILLLAIPELRDLMDVKIYMDTPLDICFIRRLRRDLVERKRTIESVIYQYESTVRPMYLQFVDPSRRYADIIVPHGGENRIAIDMIKAKMREMLRASH